MAAEKITEVPLESIRLLESKGRTAATEPLSTYVQAGFEVLVQSITVTFITYCLCL